MTTQDRIGRSLFVALAVGLAWGIRGDFGHVIGAMYPGAILGLAWVAVSGSPALVRRMSIIAGLTATGIGAGGTMSYGILHGYAQADSVINYSYGLFTLFCQGGCWGTFGGCLAGLLADRRSMRTGDWLGLLVSVFLGGWVTTTLLVEVLGFQVNPPRNNISVAFLGAAIGQFLWLIVNRRSYGLRGATLGFVGFGLGMAGGRVLANAMVHLENWGWTINHWNVMEITCGFVGGGIFTYGMLGLGPIEPAGEESEFRGPAFLGALYVLAVIPFWHLFTRVPERIPQWTKSLQEFGYADPEGLTSSILTNVYLLCSIASIGAIIWGVALYRGWRWPVWFPVVWLSLTMILFQNLTALYFWRPSRPGYLNTHHGFWILFILMLLYAIFLAPQKARYAGESESPPKWGRIVLATIGAFALLIGLASLTNGERTMKTANTRWPIWTWTQGPFPGPGKTPSGK